MVFQVITEILKLIFKICLGKSSKRGKGKSTRPLPPRLASERLKKSNIFYTSDGNSDEDFLSDDDDEGSEKLTKQRGSKSKLNNVSRVVSDDSDSDTPVLPAPRGRGRPPKSATPKKKNSVKTKSTSKKLTSDNEETPIHRKVRSTRSRRRMIHSEEEEGTNVLNGSRSRRRRIHSEDDEGTNELNGLEKENVSALMRSSRSARFQKKDYNEVDSDAADETDSNHDDSETEEEEVKDHSESEEETMEEDSEDEIMNESLKSSTQKSSKNKSSNGVLKRSKNFEDSDSDAVVPHKRKRLRSSSPVKVTKKMHPVKTKFPTKNESRKVRGKDSSGRQTRNRGQQKVTYLEDYGTDDDAAANNTDDDSENDSESENDTSMAYSRSVSSRGRVRKLTARAKASLKGH